MSTISNSLLKLMDMEARLMGGTAIVTGAIYKGVSFLTGASKEWHTGFKDSYDTRCLDKSSEFFKTNPFCQE